MKYFRPFGLSKFCTIVFVNLDFTSMDTIFASLVVKQGDSLAFYVAFTINESFFLKRKIVDTGIGRSIVSEQASQFI